MDNGLVGGLCRWMVTCSWFLHWSPTPEMGRIVLWSLPVVYSRVLLLTVARVIWVVVVVGLFVVGFGNTAVAPPCACDSVAYNFCMDLDGPAMALRGFCNTIVFAFVFWSSTKAL